MVSAVAMECTRILMHGSPEQTADESRVRFTPNAQLFLQRCAAAKGLLPKR